MTSIFERAMSRLQRTEGECWLWPGSCNDDGYGLIRAGASSPQRRGYVLVHRVVYEHLVGAIPEGLVSDHLCRTRNCANPDHIELVSNKENILRGASFSAVNARKTHCPSGHPYSGRNLKVTYRGWRICKVCRAKEARRRRADAKRASQSSHA